ncbi:MAG TPA: cupin domain-containing protein [Steroidobacteraceae bacterium]|nr:cupin domain-containing protein [Steroidobacteraceae bacterium]
MKKIDLSAVETVIGSGYPAPHDEPCRQRKRLRLGDAAGLTQFGVNLLRLAPGVWSSQRHWHSAEDEFVYVLAGEVVLVSDAGEEVLRAGDCAGFKAGERDGHQLQNRANTEAIVLEIGARNPDRDAVDYPDIDLTITAGTRKFTHKDGTPYPPRPR